MKTQSYSTYDEAVQDYLEMFRALREASAARAEVTTRGAGDVAAEALVRRAGEIAGVSAAMVPLARGYLEAADPILREGISGQLLAQAAAELQVATELLQIAQGEGEGAPLATTRGAREATLGDAIGALERAMASPVGGGLLPELGVSRGAVGAPATVEEAKQALQQAAVTSTGAIAQQVRKFGGDVAWSLVFQTQWGAVIDGVGLLHKDVAAKLEAIKHGVGAFLDRAVAAAGRTLLNVYDKVLALLGKDAQDQARQKVREWLEQIKAEGKIDLFGKLVDRLYQVDAFAKDLDGWLAQTSADLQQISATTDAVGAVSAKFTVLMGRMKTLEEVIGMAKAIQVPQALAVVAGIQVALLAVLIYAGYDYVGYKQPKFPNLTQGVAEVIQEKLVTPA